MRPSEALQKHKDDIRKAALARKACNVRVFGSVLYGRDRAGSDIDILVDPLPGATLCEPGGLQDDLQHILGAPVDLLTPGDLPIKFRDNVLREAREI